MRTLLALLAIALFTAQAAAADPAPIPLVEGMVFSSANAWSWGDEENIVTLAKLDESSASFSVVFRDAQKPDEPPRAWVRRVRLEDLAESHRINNLFQAGDADVFAGSTFMHLSAAAFNELKSKGETAMVLGTMTDADYEGLRKMQDRSAQANFMFPIIASGRKYFRGTLKRVGSSPVPMTVLVNGKSQQLPSIATAGRFTVGGDVIDAQYWWLDDPQNALQLRSRRGQLIRIDYPESAPEKTLAQSLSSGNCRATLPGIYFDTGSARLLPQSEAALQSVAATLKANPGWALTIEGHTDNVGRADYNLDLSKRRATAVQKALQGRAGVGARQLTATGYGMSRPVQGNDTLEGRAANRRVELLRDCH